MSESPSTTWVGGRLPFSVDVEGLEASEQLLTLWVELPALLVVGQWLEDVDNPDTTFVQTLSSAMSSPLVGAARRPTRVRVADEALAAELRALPDLEVEVAPTPELDRVIKSLAAFVGTGSYFSDPLLTTEALADFFDATAALYTLKPWELAEDNALIYVENDALGVSDSAISLTGGGTDVPGIALYPRYEDYEQMRDVLAGDEDSALEVSHSALYLLFADAEHTPEAMRVEVAAQQWKLAEPGRYPVLNRLLDGKPAPVLHTDVRVATVLARALQKFVGVHRDALEQYGELPAQESYSDGTGGETVLTVPHPEVDLAEFEEAPRADTLSEEGNPYALPLSNKELGLLERGLNKFSLHRLIGMLVGVASVPEPLAPSAWMALLTSPPKAASELEMKHVIGLMMQVHNDVVARLSEWEIAGLVPVAEDVHACREWARGFASVCDEVELGEQTGEAIDTLFAIYVLAEKPAYLKVLDEHRGEVSREERTDEFRDLLGDAVSFLYDHWEKARAAAALPAAKKAEPIRAEPKTGRNDPCPCGSGKKFKKCHG